MNPWRSSIYLPATPRAFVMVGACVNAFPTSPVTILKLFCLAIVRSTHKFMCCTTDEKDSRHDASILWTPTTSQVFRLKSYFFASNVILNWALWCSYGILWSWWWNFHAPKDSKAFNSFCISSCHVDSLFILSRSRAYFVEFDTFIPYFLP